MDMLAVGLFLLFWIGAAINAWKVILIDDRKTTALKDWPGSISILIAAAAIPVIIMIAILK